MNKCSTNNRRIKVLLLRIRFGKKIESMIVDRLFYFESNFIETENPIEKNFLLLLYIILLILIIT